MNLHLTTEYCGRLNLARVLVEVNLEKPLSKKIYFKGKEGQDVTVWNELPISPS